MFCLDEIDRHSFQVLAPDNDGYLDTALGALKNMFLLHYITWFKIPEYE
jgi:hypothetical protein